VDYATENILDLVQEANNEYLDNAFDDAVDEANFAMDPPLDTEWTVANFPSSALLQFGVLKQVLIGKGVWSARNAVDYSDSGGVNVRAFNKWEKYLPWLNQIDNRWVRGVTTLKRKLNFNAGWGNIESEYSIYGY